MGCGRGEMVKVEGEGEGSEGKKRIKREIKGKNAERGYDRESERKGKK